MVEIFKREYWSKSNAFLLPLTGMKRNTSFDVESYLYWGDYIIDDYKLTVKVTYGHRYNEFQDFLRENVFTQQKSFITESFDFEGFTILIYDISEWAFDIEQFMAGKYSKLSKEAKHAVQEFHTFYEDDVPKINVGIYACLNPNSKERVLDNMTGIEYAIKHYVIDPKNPSNIDLYTAKALRDLGELCSICDKEKETLVIIGQVDIPNEVE